MTTPVPDSYSPVVLVHQLLGAFALPPLNLILLLLLGLWLLRRRPALGRGLIALGLAALYLLFTPQVAMWLTAPLEAYPPIAPQALQQAQAIVVLGGGKKPAPEYGGNEPSGATLARVRYAAHLARQSGLPILLSGGAPLGGEPEARVMARTLSGDYGVAPRWLEDASNTTADNARLAAAQLKQAGVQRIALVSQGWHLRRAIPLFQAQGLTVLPAPTGYIRYDGGGIFLWLPQGRSMQESHQALREWVGLAYQSLKFKP